MTSSEVFDYGVFRVEQKCVVRGHDAGKSFTFLRCPDWVNVVAFTSCGRLALVRQFRHSIDEHTVEFPGGIVDQGVTPLESAKRELLEETGLVSSEWHHVGCFRPNAALQDNWCHTYLCGPAEPSSVCTEEGCEAFFTDAPNFVTSYKRQLLSQALMATAITLAQEADLPDDLRRLCNTFFL